MSNMVKASFSQLDLGSAKPTSVPMETIEVEICAEDYLSGFGEAFVNECYRVHPRRAEQVNLTSEELSRYAKYLLTKRIECVNGECKDYRKLKGLYIPSWIQHSLCLIGNVIMRDIGLSFKPVMAEESDMTLEEALKVSDKIGMFIDDLQIVQDAMPREITGDKDVMSTAMIAGYVRSIKPVEHVSSTYMSAFLGMKLKEEAAMSVLYRVQYDDVNFIIQALMTQRGIF